MNIWKPKLDKKLEYSNDATNGIGSGHICPDKNVLEGYSLHKQKDTRKMETGKSLFKWKIRNRNQFTCFDAYIMIDTSLRLARWTTINLDWVLLSSSQYHYCTEIKYKPKLSHISMSEAISIVLRTCIVSREPQDTLASYFENPFLGLDRICSWISNTELFWISLNIKRPDWYSMQDSFLFKSNALYRATGAHWWIHTWPWAFYTPGPESALPSSTLKRSRCSLPI